MAHSKPPFFPHAGIIKGIVYCVLGIEPRNRYRCLAQSLGSQFIVPGTKVSLRVSGIGYQAEEKERRFRLRFRSRCLSGIGYRVLGIEPRKKSEGLG